MIASLELVFWLKGLAQPWAPAVPSLAAAAEAQTDGCVSRAALHQCLPGGRSWLAGRAAQTLPHGSPGLENEIWLNGHSSFYHWHGTTRRKRHALNGCQGASTRLGCAAPCCPSWACPWRWRRWRRRWPTHAAAGRRRWGHGWQPGVGMLGGALGQQRAKEEGTGRQSVTMWRARRRAQAAPTKVLREAAAPS